MENSLFTWTTSPSSAFCPFFGEGFLTKVDYRKKGALILTSPLGDLVDPADVVCIAFGSDRGSMPGRAWLERRMANTFCVSLRRLEWPKSGHTVDERNPFRTTLKPYLKPLFVGIYVGIKSFRVS